MAEKAQTRASEGKPDVEQHDVEAVKITDVAGVVYDVDDYNEMVDMYDSTIKNIKEGEIVQGTVIGVSRDDVIVDVGFKSEGIIPMAEFQEPLTLKNGDEIEVFLEQMEDGNGNLVLSKQKADFMRVWDKIREVHDSGEKIAGRVVRRIKGGLVVDIMGVDAFLPGSQVALRQVADFDALIGEEMQLKIIKLNKARRNIVVSRRTVLEEKREKMRSELLSEIAVGQVRQGTVKNITDFGVFIDLGGVDGLLHITDMSWGRIRHPSEMCSLGESIDVKILDFDEETSRISLGLKQLTPYPWENIEQKYPLGKKVTGRVVSITDYGAFVELEKGVEGLIHISEMSWTQHIKHPSKIMNVNDQVETVVLSVDKENEKISLGIKQLEPDPWGTIDEKYPVGQVVAGKVRNLTAFGAFVELEEGIDGLVHISDMSWTKRIQHPSEVMKKGDTVEVKVLKVDHENRRISLGYKQLQEDPWGELARKYAVGTECLGTITRVMDRGVIVELDGNVEGFVPTAQLGRRDLTDPQGAFHEGEELPLSVIEFDRNQHKIVLSVYAYYKKRDRNEFEAFLERHQKEAPAAMEEAMPDDLKKEVEEAREEVADQAAKEAVEASNKPEPDHQAEPAEEPTAEPAAEEAEEPKAEAAPAEPASEEPTESAPEEPTETAESGGEESTDEGGEEGGEEGDEDDTKTE
ncbi:30S ribosomal protein S1 [candidate division GN15 bacterium]|nr:30S ribosomal protein S1 [candidate division GN15 bacterium]